MPITIWEPARYAEGFYKDKSGIPINGANAPAPFDRDTKVREITRFEGFKQVYYCDTGTFEITTADVLPTDVKDGFMLEIEGDMFVIEDYEWFIEDGIYKCTMSGRDFWKFPESEINRRYVGIAYNTSNGKFSGLDLLKNISIYMQYSDMKAGWFRDMRRFPWAVQTFPDYYENITAAVMDDASAFLKKDVGEQVAREIMPYASEWRLFASWFGVGIRFRFVFNDVSGLYEIHPEIYDGEDGGVTIKSTDRGVSDFSYRYSTQTAVNAVFAGWESSKYSYTPTYVRYQGDDFKGAIQEFPAESDGSIANILDHVSDDGAKSYSERVAMFSEKYINAGKAQQDSETTGAAMMTWVKNEVMDSYVKPEKAFGFSYDNTGLFRYGKHFALGDKITVKDDYLGVSSKQRLTGVKTVYQTEGKTYEFEFSNQRTSQNDILKRKFAELDRRTNINARRV